MDWTWIKTSYPFEQTTIEKRNTIIIISLFTSLLMFFLQPFGFTVYDNVTYFFWFSLIGLSSISINYFGFPYLFPAFFEEKKWSILKAFLFLSYNFLILGLWHHIFSALFIKGSTFYLSSGAELLTILIKVTLIGGITSGFLILFRYHFLARKHLQISQEINSHLRAEIQSLSPNKVKDKIVLSIENKRFEFASEELHYISAEGNYVAFHTKNNENSTSNLVRSTMGQVEMLLQDRSEFFKCHRSFMVNLNAIESTHGNSQGLSVKIYGEADRIPVARSKIKHLRHYLDAK